MLKIKCKFEPINNNNMKFEPQTEGSAGLDLIANTDTAIVLEPNESYKIPTGFFVEIPEGYVGILAVRSSIGSKLKTNLTHSIGVIDSDYRGEVKADLINHSDTTVTIQPNERIVQLLIVPYLKPYYELVDELSTTERGEGGFGSTGKQ